MPKKMHNMLKKQARKKGLKGEKADAYIYGTMNKIEKAGKKKRKKKDVTTPSPEGDGFLRQA